MFRLDELGSFGLIVTFNDPGYSDERTLVFREYDSTIPNGHEIANILNVIKMSISLSRSRYIGTVSDSGSPIVFAQQYSLMEKHLFLKCHGGLLIRAMKNLARGKPIWFNEIELKLDDQTVVALIGRYPEILTMSGMTNKNHFLALPDLFRIITVESSAANGLLKLLFSDFAYIRHVIGKSTMLNGKVFVEISNICFRLRNYRDDALEISTLKQQFEYYLGESTIKPLNCINFTVMQAEHKAARVNKNNFAEAKKRIETAQNFPVIDIPFNYGASNTSNQYCMKYFLLRKIQKTRPDFGQYKLIRFEALIYVIRQMKNESFILKSEIYRIMVIRRNFVNLYRY